MSKHKEELEHRLKLRNIQLSDYNDIRELMTLIYEQKGMAYTRQELKNQIKAFPEGQI